MKNTDSCKMCSRERIHGQEKLDAHRSGRDGSPIKSVWLQDVITTARPDLYTLTAGLSVK